MSFNTLTFNTLDVLKLEVDNKTLFLMLIDKGKKSYSSKQFHCL